MIPEPGWGVWGPDPWTWVWSLWILYFFVAESVAVVAGYYPGTLTAHLRPVLAAHPLAWFLTLGIWLWIGFHFLVEGVFIRPVGA